MPEFLEGVCKALDVTRTVVEEVEAHRGREGEQSADEACRTFGMGFGREVESRCDKSASNLILSRVQLHHLRAILIIANSIPNCFALL